jgi:Mannosyltransferase (PIG-V)
MSAAPPPAVAVGLARRIGPERAAALSGAWEAFWTSRLALWVVGLFAILKTGFFAGVASPREIAPFDGLGNLLVGPLARWDSYWYLHIAATGYHPAGNAAFFPLYPLLCAAGGWLVGSALIAGVLISLVSLLAMLYLLWRLVTLELGEPYARPAVLVCAFFPMALFFSAVYSESLFLALTVGAFYCARLDRWALAGLLGGLAAATRNTGALLLVPLVLLYLYGPRGAGARWRGSARRAGLRATWRERAAWRERLRPRFPIRPDLLWLALVPAGLGAFMLYLAVSQGDALASVHATQGTWQRYFHLLRGIPRGATAAWDGLKQILSGSDRPMIAVPSGSEFSDPERLAVVQITDFAFLLYAAVACVGVLRRLPFAYGAYCLAALGVAVSAPVAFEPLASLPRYVAGIFPLQIWLAVWAQDRRRVAIVVGASALALAMFESQFATWRWVA